MIREAAPRDMETLLDWRMEVLDHVFSCCAGWYRIAGFIQDFHRGTQNRTANGVGSIRQRLLSAGAVVNIFVEEVFTTLLNGAALAIPHTDEFHARMQYCEDHGITFISVPSRFPLPPAPHACHRPSPDGLCVPGIRNCHPGIPCITPRWTRLPTGSRCTTPMGLPKPRSVPVTTAPAESSRPVDPEVYRIWAGSSPLTAGCRKS